MNEKLLAIKASISASLRRTQAFYSSHRTLLLSGLTVLSILLIVWARLGFTVQVGQFFAAGECSTLGGSCQLPSSCTAGGGQQSADSPANIDCYTMNTEQVCCVPAAGAPPSSTTCGFADRTNPACACNATTRVNMCHVCTPSYQEGNTDYSDADYTAWDNTGLCRPSCPDSRFPYQTERTKTDGTAFPMPQACVEKPSDCPSGYYAVGNTQCASDSATPTPAGTPAPAPGGRPAAAVLTVSCTGTTAKLDWNIPSGIIENVIQKNINNQGWQIAYSDPTKTVKTFSESFVATTVYRHKTDPNVVSNSVQCPSGAATATPTPIVQIPSVLTAICGATQNKLDWTLPAGHDSNSIQRKLGVSGPWTTIGTGFTLTAPVSFTDTTIQAGQTYIYRHKAWASTPSNEVTCPSPTPTPTVTATVTVSPSLSPTPAPGPSFILALSGRNVTTASTPSAIVQAQGGQQVEVIMLVRNTQTTLNNVVVRATLPAGLTYVAGSTSVVGIPTAVESITTGGLSLGVLGPQQETTVVFRARVVGSSFVVGTTQVEIAVSASADGATQQNGVLPVVVTRAVATVPGTVKTGPGDAVLAALLMSAIMTLLYVSYTHTSAYKRKEIEAITRNRDPMDFRS